MCRVAEAAEQRTGDVQRETENNVLCSGCIVMRLCCAAAVLCGGCFSAEMVEERSKHPLKPSEKLDDVYKAQKKAKKM